MSVPNWYIPKFGKLFKVIGVARISTENQDTLSLDDQEVFFRKWLDKEYGPDNYDLIVIAHQGSGQILDNVEFLKVCELVSTGEYDLVIAEDLSRIIRRMQAVIFCEEAEALGTRVVGIGDPVDTSKEGLRWPSSGGLAIFDFMQQFAV